MMKKLLKNSIVALTFLAAFSGFSQTVSDITVTATGTMGTVVTPNVTAGQVIQIESGSSFDVEFTVSVSAFFIERSFSVVKVGDPKSGDNFFNAQNLREDNGTTTTKTTTRTINVPANGMNTATGETVNIGNKHTVVLNGKAYSAAPPSTDNDWGTSTDFVIEIVAPGTLSTNSVSKEKISLSVSNGSLNVSKPADYTIYSITGVQVLRGEAIKTIDISKLSNGIYIYKTQEGTAKFVK
ncbi:T9SS type A sorting domain-containing protein [Flavivirga rizhaonensis]|uniref:T9SS type A sorting domain-containing protein n=1 Tax=Flavivirga rizhaonensis TaxID=2559571 RepID=A0A4S1E0C4_9FLAO|nr:T9SS type A sorting domain-containing protein [Flavivirga rizhaonensis]TGV04006.1 T9SS type A sorting domain-containing protein [Flavivirga rizhaonensis]